MTAAPPPILTFGDPGLRRRCRPAEPGAGPTAEVLDRLWAALKAGAGVGLAAPQIGVDLRILVVSEPLTGGRRRELELVNPEIGERCGPERGFEEGCLSFPGLYLRVRRPEGVIIHFHDRQGRRQSLQDKGLAARIIQHEVDHLDGRLFIDRLPAWRRLAVIPRLWWLQLTAGKDSRKDLG